MAEFSLELNDDQKQIQSWVHDFADTVLRPNGEEWDEREAARASMDVASADRIRDELAAGGSELIAGPSGPTWRRLP
jgi:cysteinyl-tRNA synthetase